ncbi:acyl carrier protein [Streptomyces sp. N2-109]|uniref:Acyl carrier protein n=1 Tax=Streptomyces gossypii TaxID=2883101 RepID=A0ABT2K354_9ACTN|nr:acyl carrier protein [Streptomyces gossypii]MCT2594591.1 acyl carrier protein [Streptomyces gossypii]
MSDDEISERISGYIRERFLSGDQQQELEETTPLLEWGVLNSMNTALLLMFIRDELNVAVPPMKINAGNFQDVKSITALVNELARQQQAATPAGTESA